MKKFTIALMLLSFTGSNLISGSHLAFAQENKDSRNIEFYQEGENARKGYITIPPGTLSVIGTFLTCSSDDNKFLNGLGWALIILGSFSQIGVSLPAQSPVYNQQSTIEFCDTADGSIKRTKEGGIDVKVDKILESVEMESLLVEARSKSREELAVVADNLILDEFAKTLDFKSEKVAAAVIKAKIYADGLLKNEKFSKKIITVKKADLQKAFGKKLDANEFKYVENYLRFRNIKVSQPAKAVEKAPATKLEKSAKDV